MENQKSIAERYLEWANSYSLAHFGTEDPRIISFINSLYEYANWLEEYSKNPPKGIINVWSNPVSCFPGADAIGNPC